MSPPTASAAATPIASPITSGPALPIKGHRAAASGTVLREFLAFTLGAEEYGIDIRHVQEIRAYEAPMRIATAPACITGVVKLRGVIVPIVDMRLKLDLASANCDSLTAVIVLNTEGRTIGLVVDAVSEVITLTQAQLLPASAFNSVIERDHLLAIGVVPGRAVRLVDIEKLLTSPDLGLVEPILQ